MNSGFMQYRFKIKASNEQYSPRFFNIRGCRFHISGSGIWLDLFGYFFEVDYEFDFTVDNCFLVEYLGAGKIGIIINKEEPEIKLISKGSWMDCFYRCSTIYVQDFKIKVPLYLQTWKADDVITLGFEDDEFEFEKQDMSILKYEKIESPLHNKEMHQDPEANDFCIIESKAQSRWCLVFKGNVMGDYDKKTNKYRDLCSGEWFDCPVIFR